MSVYFGNKKVSPLIVQSKQQTNTEVQLVLAGGNQDVIAPNGYLYYKVTIVKPDTLVSNNIRKGVTIAGVIGTMEEQKEEEEKTIDITANNTYIVLPTDGKTLSKVTAVVTVSPTLQSKSVTPSTTQQIVTSDDGYQGLSQVIVYKAPTETIEITPTKEVQTKQPSDGKVGYSEVTVKPIPDNYIIPSGTLEITGNGTYDVSGKANANVNVPTGVDTNDATAVSGDILQGKTAYAKGVKLTGSVETYDGTFVIKVYWKASVSNLGAENPATVVFNTPADSVPKPWSEVEFNGDVFIKFPKMYRKIVTITDNQITAFEIANAKLDDDYKLYPCFIDESGNELDYILVGKYMSKSSDTCNSVASGRAVAKNVETARNFAKARGTGYQLFDWRIHKLWQDLLICTMKTVDTNNGSGITTDALGLVWDSSNSSFIDGFVIDTGFKWAYSNSPSKYINNPNSLSDSYSIISGYDAAKKEGSNDYTVKKLGYDTSQPFFNYPSEMRFKYNSWDTYYCDEPSLLRTNKPMASNVGQASAYAGAFHLMSSAGWTATFYNRLCYRPISS